MQHMHALISDMYSTLRVLIPSPPLLKKSVGTAE